MAENGELVRELGQLRAEVQSLREEVQGLLSSRRPKVERGRIRTHVDGFDDGLGGGIPEGHVVVLTGPSGSMKTSLALSVVHNNRRDGTKGLYISLEEGRDSLLRTMEQLGMKNTEDFIVDIAKMRMEHEDVEGARDWLQIFKEYLARRMEKERIGILVIDPLNALYSLADLRNPRRDLFHFFTYLRGLGVTAILVVETHGTDDLPNNEGFLADGSISLHYANTANGHVDLRIRCVKMRHTNHDRSYLRLEFDGGRFRATPIEPNGR